jgi:anion-transporting  ArsA/GET3 family ATPase
VNIATSTKPAAADLLGAIDDKQVVLCLGSGGVGKTTTSAALAIALAKRGERVVVLTIDPARRLADTLGRSGTLGNEPIRVDGNGLVVDGEVWAAMLDPAETFEQIIRSEAADDAQAERILANRLFINLTTSLSGTNEYMAAERVFQLHNDDRFDRVIVDTPPSRHAMDFLDSPSRLTRFVDHRLYRSVFAPKHRLLKPLNAGTQVVMKVLGRLVGSNLVSDVVSFFSDFEGMDQGFRLRADGLEQLLTGPHAGYVLVTAARGDRLQESAWIVGNLAERSRPLDAVVVNRVLPFDPTEADAEIAALTEARPAKGKRADATDALVQNLVELTLLARQEAELIDQLRAQLSELLSQPDEALSLTTVSEQLQPIRDIDGLAELADLL